MTDLSILDDEYAISREQIDFYHENAFIKLKDVLPPDTIAHFNDVISTRVIELNTMHLPLEERNTHDKAFLQVQNLWRLDDEVRRLVFSKRLARIATDLMQTVGVRLYHDQALYKEPGGGFTPWHADQFYWPLDGNNTITVWIPLHAVPVDMGALEFSARSHSITGGRDIGIGEDSEATIGPILDSAGFELVSEPFDLGEVSYHAGWCFHRAGPNTTKNPREVMTIIYMDEDIRLKPPENDNQQLDWETWLPGATIGGLADTPINPVLYTRK